MKTVGIKNILEECKEIALDYSSIERISPESNSAILILGENNQAQEFFALLSKDYPQTYLKSKDEIKEIRGHFGSYEIVCQSQTFIVGQIVLFYEDDILSKLKGVHLSSDFHNSQELKTALEKMPMGGGHLSKLLSYHSSKCQYHHRFLHSQTCLNCLNTCPAFAIQEDGSKRELSFFDIDCTDCGKCAMVCPSGAIQRFAYNQESLASMAKLYHNLTPILCTQEPDLELIPQGFAPLLLPTLGLLSETLLLTLIQESSSALLILTQEVDEDLEQRITLINEIFERIFEKRAIFLISNLQELQTLSPQVTPSFHYTLWQTQDEFVRKIFAERLRYFIKENSFGSLSAPSYGKISINPTKCTLCNSCVGVCNTQSLIAQNFEILHNPSLCTACGYCTKICPEDAIEETFGVLELQNSWFEYQPLVGDEGFACVECKKIFSNKKPIERIKKQMIPLLNGDPLKIKALECCSDCKVKIMFEEH